VVNRLPLAKPIDDALIARINDDLIPGAKKLSGFRRFQLVQNSDTEAIVIVHFETREVAERMTFGKLVAGGPA